MSTAPADPSSAPPTPPGAVPVYEVPAPGASDKPKRPDNITIYGHSNLFYWWPIWAVCFVLAAWSYLDGKQMAVLPAKTQEARGVEVKGYEGPRNVLVAPPNQDFDLARVETTDEAGNKDESKGPKEPASMTVSGSNSLGVIFAFTVFIVALVSTLTLRGLVSLIVIILMIAVVLALALLGWWDDVFRFLGGLDIRMNAAGYLFIGTPIFLIWCFVTFVYDRQHYIIFDEGQIRYVREVGDSEVVLDSSGALVEKKRDDVFRHWLVGFGSGDIQVRTGGSHGQTIEMENVLLIHRKLPVINDFLQHRAVASD